MGYDSTETFDVVFECKVPETGEQKSRTAGAGEREAWGNRGRGSQGSWRPAAVVARTCLQNPRLPHHPAGLPPAPPSTTPGEQIWLAGFGAFDAATHCAAVSAARRRAQKPAKPSPGPNPTTCRGAGAGLVGDLSPPASAAAAARRPRPPLPARRGGVMEFVEELPQLAPSAADRAPPPLAPLADDASPWPGAEGLSWTNLPYSAGSSGAGGSRAVSGDDERSVHGGAVINDAAWSCAQIVPINIPSAAAAGFGVLGALKTGVDGSSPRAFRRLLHLA
jgi:hypothetical protein